MGSSVLLKGIMVIEQRDLQLKREYTHMTFFPLKHKRQMLGTEFSFHLYTPVAQLLHGFDSGNIHTECTVSWIKLII